ncbi:MAG: hypothetical protein LUH08_06395 [Ruminococcus sp.]|nr:hypothetical protein [Ruminococcus sp.]MCD7773666.1 hypothetical protein [Ruminococcus sp.]
MDIDYRRLRRDLKDYYGTAMFSASPLAMFEESKVERASDRDLIRLAQEAGFDLNDYME